MRKPIEQRIKEMNTQTMYNMCLHKKIYRTKEFAKQKAEEFTQKFGKPQSPYLCPLCGYYHLTTKEV